MRKRMILTMLVFVVGFALVSCGDSRNELIDDTAQKAAGPGKSATAAPERDRTTDVDVAPAADAESIPDVVAEVGERKITRDEFKRQLDHQLTALQARYGQRIPANDQIRAMVLKSLIDSTILTELAEQSDAEVSREKVEAELEKGKESMPSEEAYQAYLEQEGLTQEGLLDIIEDRMATEKFVEDATEDLAVTEKEVEKRYAELKEAGKAERSSGTTDVSHILIGVEKDATEEDWQEAKKRIAKARERVMSGESFADVAKDVSEDPGSAPHGGSYEEVEEGQMVPEFDKVMKNTPVGEVSEPFKTQYGWHILKVDEKNEAGTIPLEELEAELREQMLRTKQREATADMIAKAKEEMSIKINYLEDLVKPEKPAAETPVEAGDVKQKEQPVASEPSGLTKPDAEGGES